MSMKQNEQQPIHFGERKPCYAILDEERGSLVAMAFRLNLSSCPTALYRTKKEAIHARDLHCPGLRVIKVEVRYTRCL